ncbi:MAG: hypothetical protein KGH59_04170 [Candidatus Micrarchaeota archaeon]|nr:hypothetical protein [Candidatus Micrarchaeota archaeon]
MVRRAVRFALCAAALLSLLGTAGAAGGGICSPIGPQTAIPLSGIPLIGIAILALSVSMVTVAIGYIIGKLVPGTQLSSWVKNEFWEIAKSAILLASIFSVLLLLGNFALLIGGSATSQLLPSGNNIGTEFSLLSMSAQAYVQSTYCSLYTPPSGNQQTASSALALGSAQQQSDYLVAFSAVTGALSSMSVGYFIPIPIPVPDAPSFMLGSSFRPFQNDMLTYGGASWSSLLTDSFNLVYFPVYIILDIEYYLIPLLVLSGLAVFIPFGLVFRALPFLRGIGGALIAIGIAISLIFPATLVIFNWPLTAIITNRVIAPLSCTGASLGGTGSTWWTTVLGSQLGNYQQISQCSSSAPDAGGLGSDAGSSVLHSMLPSLNGLLDINIFAIVQFLLFIFDLMIIFPVASSIATSLGGSISLSLGRKLKIV